MQDVVGKDLMPYGVEANRVTLDAFLQYAFEQGVCHRRLKPEELFPPQVQKSFKVSARRRHPVCRDEPASSSWMSIAA